MAEIIKRKKALSVNPLKASQPIGGALATLGFNRAIPMLHGSQGCTAFAKVFFVRHFREPIPLQTTAMDQGSSVMGADENVVEGLKAIAEKSHPELITLLTTGLSETQGADVQRNVREFRSQYPQFDHVAVVAVNTPDFSGCAETGYAKTVTEIIGQLVPDTDKSGSRPGTRKRQVNVLASAMLTPGDIEALLELFEQFDLRPLFIPDISNSLDGVVTDEDFSPLTIGGTSISELQTAGESVATIQLGSSMKKAAELLHKKTGVPNVVINDLYGLAATDLLVMGLSELSRKPVPQRVERQRMQLQDALLDTHFMLGQLRVGIAAEADQLSSLAQLIKEAGAETVAAVAPSMAPCLHNLALGEVKIGDLEDLELLGREKQAQLLIGNSHTVATAERLKVPILRAGFPLYDVVGGYQKCWVGYRGARQALFDLANLVIHFAHESIPAYRSIYTQKSSTEVPPSCH